MSKFIDLSQPWLIILLFQALMPFSLIALLVIFILIYFITKKFIVKKTFNIKNYVLLLLSSLIIFYALLIGLMYFVEIGLGRISQYI